MTSRAVSLCDRSASTEDNVAVGSVQWRAIEKGGSDEGAREDDRKDVGVASDNASRLISAGTAMRV